jgi:hypothetical protein
MIDKETWQILNYGFTTIPVYACGITVVLISLFNLRDRNARYLNGILLLGSFAFLIRLFELLIRFSDMFKAISLAEIPDIQAIAIGLSELMLFSLNGLTVLIISLIFWGTIKAILTIKKIN